MPSMDLLETTGRARAIGRQWRAAQARSAARASGALGIAPVDGTSLSERTLYVLAVALLPVLCSFVL